MGRSKRSVRDEIAGLQPAGDLELVERRLAAKSAELNAAKADNKRLIQRNAELSSALERFAAIQEAKRPKSRG